ncbi:MAG: urea carboxylase-associated family protein [Spongiibacteraceae bacterium]
MPHNESLNKSLFASTKPLYRDEIEGGKHWSFVIKRDHVLRIIDKDGGANVGMLFYNPLNPLERYNAPDTLKCQHTFKLTKGHCLYSDMGRIFCSIVDDTCGWHDTVAGTSNKALVKNRWGEHNYQQFRNDWYLNGYDSFLVELAKYGLGRKDLAANVNWFSKVAVDDAGNFQYDESHSKAGNYVDLRFEMDTLVIFNTCPHPLNKSSEYPRKSIIYEFYEAAPRAADDFCEHSCCENERGFKNNALYHLQATGAFPIFKNQNGFGGAQ